MRSRFLIGILAMSFVGFALIETDGQAQQFGGGFDFKDPKGMFSRYTQSQGTKDYIEIDKIQSRMDPELPAKLKAFAAKSGNTTGKVNLDQFSDFWTKEQVPALEAKMQQPGGGFGGKGGGFGQKDAPAGGTAAPVKDAPQQGFGGKGGGFGPGGGFGQKDAPMGGQKDAPMGGFGPGGGRGFGREAGKDSPMGGEKTAGNVDPNKQPLPPIPPLDLKEIERQADEKAKEWFFRRDRNRDGFLVDDEMSDEMRAEKTRWDTNKNNQIEYEEFVVYARDRVLKEAQEKQRYEEFKRNIDTKGTPGTVNPNATGPSTTVIEERKNVVIRADNLPKELPSWFKELDTDRDAQVGLYEWREAKKDFEEFLKNDRNGDGLITVEEVLWLSKNADRLAGVIPTAPATTTPAVKDAPGATSERPGRGNRDSNAEKDKTEKDKAAEKDKTAEKTKDSGGKDGKGKDNGGRPKWGNFTFPMKDAPAKDTPAKDK